MKANVPFIVLAGIFYALPFSDLLTGMLLSFGLANEGGLSSPSQLARMLLLVLLSTRLRNVQMGIIASILGLVMVSEIIGAFFHQSGYGVGIGFANGFKLAYVTTLVLVLSDWIAEREISPEELAGHALNGGMIYAINVILALVLGFGEKTYGEENFGTKGFVPSNNGLSMTLGTLLVLGATMTASPWGRIRNLVLMFGCLFIGAKASIVFCLAFLGILLVRARPLVKVTALVGCGAAVLVLLEKLTTAFKTVFDVILFRYELSDGNLFKFLASGRDAYIGIALGNLHADAISAVRLLTGLGALVSFRDLTTLAPLHASKGTALVYETLETDLFDLLFQYGLVASTIYLSVITFVALRFLHRRMLVHLACWLLVSGFSLVAGHVLFNGMSATVVAVLVAISVPPSPLRPPEALDAPA